LTGHANTVLVKRTQDAARDLQSPAVQVGKGDPAHAGDEVPVDVVAVPATAQRGSRRRANPV